MNPKLRALLEKKATLVASAKALIAKENTEGSIVADDLSKYNALLADIEDLNRQIAAERGELEFERNAPALGSDSAGGGHPSYLRQTLGGRGRRYAEMFAGVGGDDGNFRAGLGEFLAVVRSGMPDQRLIMAAASGSSGGVGADGGFLVPTQFVAEMMDASLENEIVRPRAAVRPMDSSSLVVAGFNTLNHSSAIGGFDAKWMPEGGEFNFQKALVTQLTLKAHKVGLLTAATNELLADASYFNREMPELMIKALGFGLDEAYLVGTGAGMPRGVLNDPALIVVAKESGQAGDTILWENIKKMYARLHPACHKNAVWVANPNTKVELLGLYQVIKNVAGTENVGGSHIPVMREEGGKFYILGIEVLFSEKMKTLGDQGDIVLADFSQYIVGIRREMTLDRSAHAGFTKDETYFRGIVRSDGMGRWNSAVTPRNGSATLSWCVALAERA